MTLPRVLALVAMMLPSAAFAHPGHGLLDLQHGLLHPLLGLDHLLAILAVGWWSARQQRMRWWIAPLSFAMSMLAGAALGHWLGIALSGIELAIALSLLALGGMLLQRRCLQVALAMPLIASFGAVHGYAHGIELSAEGAPLAWMSGMFIATIGLHVLGIASARLVQPRAAVSARVAGATVTGAGVVLLAALLAG